MFLECAALAKATLIFAGDKDLLTMGIKILARSNRDLLRKLEETGLIFANAWSWIPMDDWNNVVQDRYPGELEFTPEEEAAACHNSEAHDPIDSSEEAYEPRDSSGLPF
jgi:hypothetical protein